MRHRPIVACAVAPGNCLSASPAYLPWGSRNEEVLPSQEVWVAEVTVGTPHVEYTGPGDSAYVVVGGGCCSSPKERPH